MFYKGIMKRGLYVMNRKIWGVLLSGAVCHVSAARVGPPMTEAPVTSGSDGTDIEWGHGRGYILPF